MEINELSSNNYCKSLRIAVVGCLHGNLKLVYDAIEINELKTGKKVDILLCCGDFESVRNENDLLYKSCPQKYKHMGQFHYYYNSETPAPYLTVFIGGNHEASNVLDNNYYGGWITQNIFYLGRAGVIKYKGIRIAGVSGIYKEYNYFKGHYEVDILKDVKSIYHVREFEISKMSHLSGKVDIFLSHDWPRNIVNRKDFRNICKTHSHWRNELETNTLGSPATQFLLQLLKPKYYLSGHMHYSYFNKISHEDGSNSVRSDARDNLKSVTQFIALDKPGKNRHYLHIFDYESYNLSDDNNIYFDEEWLAITKAFNPFIHLKNTNVSYSKFFVKNSEYLKIILENFNKDYTDKIIEPPIDFENLIKEYFMDFINMGFGKIIWEYLTDESQRNAIIKLLGIEDYHKLKIKEIPNKIIKNSEEIDIEF